MSGPVRRRSALPVLAVLTALVLGTASATATAATGDTPDTGDGTSWRDLGRPTQEQLARSVQVWDPTGNVRTWDPSRSVKGLVVEDRDGAESVITLTADLLFAFGSAELAPSTAPAIAEAVAALPQGAAVSIGGHTDSVSGDDVNVPLSQQRAEAVAAVVRGARPDLRLTVEGFGSSRPVAQNSAGGEDDPAGRALNRRVELRYAG